MDPKSKISKAYKEVNVPFFIALVLSLLIQYGLESYFYSDFNIYRDSQLDFKVALFFLVSLQPFVIAIAYLYKKEKGKSLSS